MVAPSTEIRMLEKEIFLIGKDHEFSSRYTELEIIVLHSSKCPTDS